MEYEISAQTLLIVCMLLAIGLLAWSLWRKGQAGQPITPEAILAAVGKLPSAAQQMYADAVIAVQYIEQVSKPDAPGGESKLTNEQKKARAMTVVKRRWPNANVELISEVVEAAVYGVKQLGGAVPTVKIVGEVDSLNTEVPR